VASVAHLAPIHLGLDVHRDTISVGILAPGREVPVVERIAHDEASIRRLVGRLGDPRRLRACYEAGPTGYELARLLDRMGIGCEVIAPSLIPTAPGDRIKTDTRDCRRLARLHRAGELVAIRIPTPAEEAVRDLCRTRADMVEDLTRARNRLGKFLLRHGRVWRGGSAWTHKHEAWLGGQRFGEPALGTTYAHYRAVVATRHAQLDAVEVDLATWLDRPPFADQVARLAAYRGVTRLGGLTLAAEVGDWRRFARAAQFMGFCGLVPSEYSSGHSVHRGRLTKAGNAHLRAQLAWVGLDLPASTVGGPRDWRPPARAGPRGGRPRMGRAAAPVRSVPRPGRPQEHQIHRGRRDRPRTGRVLVGRDGGLTPPPPPPGCAPSLLIGRGGEHHLYDAPGRRRCRTDPRRHYAAASPKRN
jgi:transposase